MSAVGVVGWAVACWLAVNGLIVLVYRRTLAALWREPVFARPVLVLESDDWGAGPLAQADALRDIAAVLDRHRDGEGRPAVMSIAAVLAVPDGPAIRRDGGYRRVGLDDARFAPVLQALRDGERLGVFALQLHGLEHCWPPALAACGDPAVAAWLRQEVPATTEDLPSHLQSRWVDASVLPSRPHDDAAIVAAVTEEVQTFARIFGVAPKVVVPPTFVWTHFVESAWAMQGIECVVTPGWRYTRRGTDGLPAGDEGPIVNGDRSGRVGYLARSDYFEPARGRDAAYALAALQRAVTEGRPCVLENHRDNFIAGDPARQRSLEELDSLFRGALERHPGLRWLSSWQLHRVLHERDPDWLVTDMWQASPAKWQRLRRSGRPWKLLRLTGAGLIGDLVLAVAMRLRRDGRAAA